jgi:hypothetical protein
MVNRSLLKVSFVVFSTFAGGCNQSTLPETLPIRSVHVAAPLTKDSYSVEELLVNPQSFAHTVVTVSGCHMGGFEMSALTACDRRSGLIWVEDAETVEGLKEFIPLLRQEGEPDESFKNLEIELLFTYNKRRNSQTWHKLPKGFGRGTPVVLLGQFEASIYRHSGFGHLGAYPNELILVDVLSNEPTPKRSKSR